MIKTLSNENQTYPKIVFDYCSMIYSLKLFKTLAHSLSSQSWGVSKHSPS